MCPPSCFPHWTMKIKKTAICHLMLMVLMLLLVPFRALIAIFMFIFFDSLINRVIYACFKIVESAHIASKHLV